MRRWAAALALASVVPILATACGLSSPMSGSSRGSSANSARLTTAAGTKVAAKAWVGHLISYVAVDPTTIGKSETGFALQADRGVLAYDQSQGTPENQYQPTGEVSWVAIPPEAPTLSEVARIETTYKPAPGSSARSSSADTLALLERKSTHARWLISASVQLQNPSQESLSEMRTLGNPLSTAAAARLPIPAQALPKAFHAYISGGESSKFASGPFTDQSRAAFESSKSSWAAAGASVTSQYSHGSVQGAYSLKDGNALVFFGVVYNNVYRANPNDCVRQGSDTPNFPPVVPEGRYQSVTFQVVDSAVAIENHRNGLASVVSSWIYTPVKASTTPTTAPACL